MADNLDETIEELEGIVDNCRRRKSRAGYFASMYLAVTREIKRSIEAGVFDDGPRMEQLDIVFARRYIDAFNADRTNIRPSTSWAISFDGADTRRPIVLQQLLTGMNAHINLDLGIAAATVAPGPALPGLHNDFIKINAVLSTMTEQFTSDLGTVSPWIGLLDRVGGTADQAVIRFSIDVARDAAWALATDLAGLEPTMWGPAISARDNVSADLAHLILHPGRLLSMGLFVIRLRESNNVVKVIDLLGTT